MTIKGSGNTLTVDLALCNNSDVTVHKPCTAVFLVRDSKNTLLESQTGKLGVEQTLAIPSKDNSSVTVEVKDCYGDIIAKRTVVYKNGTPANLSQNNKVPKILAVSSFLDFSGTASEHIIITIAVRDRIVADLVQNYDCLVISRSNGLKLSSENALNLLNAADRGETLNAIPAADYSVMGYFSRGIVLPNGKFDNFRCNLFTPYLKNNTINESSDREVFTAEYRTGYSDDILPVIAKKLDLYPKTLGGFDKTDKQLNETWAVMPFTRLLSTDGYTEAKSDSDLSIKLELALQESGKIKTIVDHSAIDKLLLENRISISDGISESTAAGIARMLGADRVLTGQVSKYKFRSDNRWRVDLFLIDGKKAIVLDAASAICKPEYIDQVVQKLVMPFVSQKYPEPELKKQSQAMRQKEANLYMEFLEGISKHTTNNNLAVRHGILLTEAAYMLIKGNPVQEYNLAHLFLYKIMNTNRSVIEENKELGARSVDLLKKLLEKVPDTKETPNPLMYLGYAYWMIQDYHKAISLIDTYLKNHTQPINNYAYFIKGQSYYSLGDYKKAAEFAEKSLNKVAGFELAIDSYRKLGDEEKEFCFLDGLSLEEYQYSERPVRYMMLSRKFKGAKYAIKQFSTLSDWTKARPEILLELAKCRLDLGEKTKALIILKGLHEDKNLTDFKGDKKAFHEEVRTLLEKLKYIKIDWKLPVQVRKPPGKYKVYIRPLGDPDMDIIKDAAEQLRKTTGFTVVILPCAPMPDDPYCYSKERGQYNVTPVWDRLLRVLSVPEDAIMLVNVTYNDLYYLDLKYINYSYSLHSGSIASYSRWGKEPKKEYGGMLAKVFSDIFFEYAFSCINCINMNKRDWGRKCSNIPCVVAPGGEPKVLMLKKYQLCPECQEEYKKLDFDKLNYVWRHMKDLPPPCSQKHASIIQQYREKVEKHFREQKK